MDNQNYLLTYVDCGEEDFGWFELEEDVRKFIIDRRVEVIECWHIKDAEKIEI